MEFNLDKVIAEGKAKPAKVKPFTFKFGGESFTLPAELDILAVAAIDEGGQRANEGMRKLLGPEQYDRMLASPIVMTNDALCALFDAYAVHVSGSTVGESGASSRSSKSTARPSKRTSTGSTRRATSRTSAPKS